MRTSASLLALLAVAACSSSSSTGSGVAAVAAPVAVDNVPALRALIDADGSTTTETTSFAAALAAFETSADDAGLADISNARFDAMPTRGTAEYTGFVQVDAGPTADLAAELELTADFAENGKITGDVTSPFFGVGPNNLLVAYEDDVEVVFGATRARGIGNGARVDIEGSITDGTDTIVVDAIIEGSFIGTPIVGARGIVNPGDTFGNGDNAVNALTLTLNEEAVTDGSVGFVVLAE